MMTDSKIHYGNATPEQREMIEKFIHRDLGRCQSSLVDMLIERGDVDGFSVDEITNLYPDPSDWTAKECKEWLDDNASSSDYPSDSNPYDMDREDLTEALESLSIQVYDHESDETLADALFDNIDTEDWGDVDDWREAVRTVAEPQEIMEWWPIADSGCKYSLERMGEPILSNDYGDWWGRTCTGQAISLDPTFWDMYQDALTK